MVSSAHGNERTFRDTRVALDKNGVITAIDSRHIDDCGAYPRYEPLGCVIWSQVFPGVYRFKNARIDFWQAVTNKCPVGPNRGYSRMQHLWFLERVVDICAHELGIAPTRCGCATTSVRRNFHTPRLTAACTTRELSEDAGSCEELDRMGRLEKEAGGPQRRPDDRHWHRHHPRFRHQQLRPVADRQSLRAFSGNSQGANCKLDIYGEVVVAVGSCPQGQGHETTAAQVVADVLNIHPDLISVRTGFDTERNVHTGFSGTYASQFAVSGLSAVHGAAQKLKAEMKRLADFVLESKPEDL